jgi:hypothetical protein
MIEEVKYSDSFALNVVKSWFVCFFKVSSYVVISVYVVVEGRNDGGRSTSKPKALNCHGDSFFRAILLYQEEEEGFTRHEMG